MKKIFLIVFYLSITAYVYSQQNAVTEKGEEVILNEDGTWRYKSENKINTDSIPLNPHKFTKDTKSTFLIKSDRFNIGFSINPKLWSFKKGADDADSEYELELKGEDLYGMIITEKTEIPLETLRLIALENAESAAPDIHIVKEEYRIVNGLKVLMIQMNGTTQGIKFSYYSYYFSNTNGTVQFVTYTAQNLLKEYTEKCEDLLNGLVETE